MLRQTLGVVLVMSVLSWCGLAFAQTGQRPSDEGPLAPPANGMRRATSTWFVLADCTLHPRPGEVVRRASVVVRNGRIEAILPAQPGPDGTLGTDDDEPARLPIGPAIINCDGQHVYAGFVEAYAPVDAPAPDANLPGNHWNPSITPQRSPLLGNGLSEGDAGTLRGLGFTAAAIVPKGGIFAGSSAVVSLSSPSDDPSATRRVLHKDKAYQFVSIDARERGGYPGSLMGSIAVVRQTLRDADWLARGAATPAMTDASMNATCLLELAGGRSGSPHAQAMLLLDASNELNALRVAKLAKEFDRPAMLLGSGRELARLDAIKATGLPIVLPLNFPKAPDVDSPQGVETTELSTMMWWEQAPTNPRRLEEARVRFALTTARLRKASEFRAHLREAMRHGLSPTIAHAALTTVPAALLGVESHLGTIEVGKKAHFVLASADIFDLEEKDASIRAVYIDGIAHEITPARTTVEGAWAIHVSPDAQGQHRSAIVTIEGKKVTLAFTEAIGKERKVETRSVGVHGRSATFVVDALALREAMGLAVSPDLRTATNAATATVSLAWEDGPVPATLVGSVVLDDGSRLSIHGARDIRTLRGTWPIDAQTLVLIAEDGSVKVLAGETTHEAAVTWDNEELLLGLGDAHENIRISPDWSGGGMVASVRRLPRDGVEGPASVVARRESNPFAGEWRVVEMDGKALPDGERATVTLSINKEGTSVTVRRRAGAEKHDAKATEVGLKDGLLTFSHSLGDLGFKQGEEKSPLVTSDTLRFEAARIARGTMSHERFARVAPEQDRIRGTAVIRNPQEPEQEATTHAYVLERVPKDPDESTISPIDIPQQLGMPFGPYALLERPAALPTFLVNATLWTNEDGEGSIVGSSTLALRDGKIAAILRHEAGATFDQARLQLGAIPEGAVVLDCSGMHVTPGIIDAHSHTGISGGVNEGGQAVTAEVRIADVTNPDDVEWYRQLAGGVTSVLSLHGSANAIGGQSQVNKLRWGCAHPDDMHFAGAIPGIKFALGENPRQVNWDRATTRYPRTRMGVETLIRDRFTAARQYAARRAADPTTRQDLELNALVEILDGTRLVHCHSYRQDEIVMLAHVARDFGFKIGTYQHILEGYKVADYVRDFSGGGSGFADWWAYKVEVQDAIPAGLPLMQKVGATTSFNSDSNNLARFLNVEAAKAVRYGREIGGIDEALALRFVTLHPAMQLKIDDRVGRLRVGMDADVAVWSRSPLSTLASVQRTFVDGRELFSRERDIAHRASIASERARLIAKILRDPKAEKERKEKAATPSSDQPPAPSMSDDERQFLRELYLRSLTSGRSPSDAPGLCGCGLPHAAFE